MPTNTEPVQLDSFPEKWDAGTANRVLDAAIRRVLDSRQTNLPTSATRSVAAPPAGRDWRSWAFGPEGGR